MNWTKPIAMASVMVASLSSFHCAASMKNRRYRGLNEEERRAYDKNPAYRKWIDTQAELARKQELSTRRQSYFCQHVDEFIYMEQVTIDSICKEGAKGSEAYKDCMNNRKFTGYTEPACRAYAEQMHRELVRDMQKEAR